MFLTIVVFFVILGIIVLVHEWGHFVTARKFGIKVDEFGLGLPPRAIGFRKDENGKWKKINKNSPPSEKTTWSLNWIPLGGFVKIKGEEGDSSHDPDSFANKPIWQRAVVLTAGVFMNVVLAIVLLTIGLMVGLPQVIDGTDLPAAAQVRDVDIRVIEVLPESPADRAGLEIADKILEVDGQSYSSVENLQQYIDGKVTEEVNLTVEREDEVVSYTIVPEILTETERGGMGVGLIRIGIVSYPWYSAWWYGIVETFSMIAAIFAGFFVIIKSLIVSQQLVGEVYGPVGIASLVGDAVDLGFLYVLQFTAVLSIIIATINYLPFPALDGGRVLFLVIEAFRGKPVNPKLEAMMHNTGFALLMILVLIVTYRDIARISGGLLERVTGIF